ncbi:hypothetical protein BH10ACI2_BH10ACI2_22530 [soil metagenome]
MPIYDVHVICTECGQPHSVRVKLDLDDDGLDKTRLSDYFDGKPLPSAVAFMQTNRYNCPHTKQLYLANDLSQCLFFASN